MPDYNLYEKKFRQASEANGMTIDVIGNIFGHDVLFASNGLKKRPGLLIISGFHGEESAAPLGILTCLQNPKTKSLLDKLNVGIVPVANPDGFHRNLRYNRLKQEDNWAMRFGPDGKPSKEGEVLLKNMDKLKAYATTCYLDMHEDSGATGFYIYANPPDGIVSSWYKKLWTIGKDAFGLQPDGLVENIPSDPKDEPKPPARPETKAAIRDGVILLDLDGSFDEWFFRVGSPFGAVTETPATQNFNSRVRCNAQILQTTLIYMGDMDFYKKAQTQPNVTVLPVESEIAEAVELIKNKQPGMSNFLDNVREIVVESISGKLGYVTNQEGKEDTIFIDYYRLKNDVNMQNPGLPPDELKKILVERIMNVLSHEKGHLAAGLDKGEGPAEQAEKATQTFFEQQREQQLTASIDLYLGFVKRL